MTAPATEDSPARRWSYDLTVGGSLLVRSWAEELVSREGSGERVVRAWLEFLTGPPEEAAVRPRSRARSRSRTYAELRTTGDLRPIAYDVFSEAGEPLWTVTFESGRARATFPDGTVLEVDAGDADFVLAANCIPHLAVVVESLDARGLPFKGTFFAPEAMRTVPYSLDVGATGIVSSMGEEIDVRDGRLVRFAIPALAVEARSDFRRRLPRWPRCARRLAGGDESATDDGRYRPPPGVAADEGSVPSRAGTPIGYTFVLPEYRDPVAVALFIGGSGAHDRHGRSGPIDLGYDQLLDGLCRRGVASLRYDKRGMGGTPIGNDVLTYGFEALVDDTRRCLAAARDEARSLGVPLVGVGHSEGGLVALRLADDPEVSGVVLLAVAARPIDEVIIEQVRARGLDWGLDQLVVEGQVAEFRQFIEAVMSADEAQWEAIGVAPRVLARAADARYYRELLAADPLALVAAVQRPMLIVHGEADLQVPVTDAARLAEFAVSSGRTAQLLVVPGVNHLLKSAATPPSIAEYYDRRRRVSRVVIDGVANWVSSLAGSR